MSRGFKSLDVEFVTVDIYSGATLYVKSCHFGRYTPSNGEFKADCDNNKSHVLKKLDTGFDYTLKCNGGKNYTATLEKITEVGGIGTAATASFLFKKAKLKT